MFIVGCIETAITALGVFLVLLTLKETRSAARAAHNADTETQNAAKQSERYSRAELRAYIYGTGVKGRQITTSVPAPGGGINIVSGYEIWLPYKNFGATPAHNVRCTVNLIRHLMNVEEDFPPIDWGFHNTLMAGPGEALRTGSVTITAEDAVGCWMR